MEGNEPGVEARLKELIAEGMSRRDAIRQTAIELKLPRKRVYEAALRDESEEK